MSDRNKWMVAGAAVSLLALGTAPLMAQEYSGAFTFGYTSGSLDIFGTSGPDVTQLSLHGDITVQFPDGFRFGGRFVHLTPDVEGLPITPHITMTELTAGFAMQNGMWFGVYTEKLDFTANGLPITLGQTYYGIEGGTSVAGVDVKAFYGTGDEMTSYGLSGRYEAARFVVGGYYAHSDTDLGVAPSTVLDLDSYGIGGAYQISQQFSVFAGAGNTSVAIPIGPGDVADVLDYGVGVSYDMTAMTNLPLVASLEYSAAKVSLAGGGGDLTLDGFTLSVTVPMGNRNGIVVPANSVAGAALNPTHSAITQMSLMSF